MVFLDLAKAFDTVCHDILLSKLDHYGIRGIAKDLLQSCLKRKQFVFVNGCKSTIVNTNYGVAQGSILGPLLFSIYVNDLPTSITCVPRLFADDTCLVYCDKNQRSLTEIINADLLKIPQWFKANKLTVNPAKSNIIIIPPKLNKPPATIGGYLDSTFIPQTLTVNYLGITIDADLKLHNHILLLERKILRTIRILSKLLILPKNALLKIYYALIHSQFTYGLIIWGSTFPSYLNKLQSLQSKAVKMIGGGSSLDNPTKFFNKFSILKPNDLFELEVAKIAHAHFTGNLPPKLFKLFTLTKNITSRATRATESSCNELYIPRYSTTRLQRCIKYQGVTIWNYIPSEIQNSSARLFKSKFKIYLRLNYC